MATIRTTSDVNAERTAYHLVRRSQAAIASYLNFGNGDLAKYLERDSFPRVAERLTEHYFHKSLDLTIGAQVRELYIALLIMAPIFQRLPLSAKFDWHRGHLISFFRTNVNARRGRFHFGARSVVRNYQPDKLLENLGQLGIHDGDMVAVLLDLYRRHAGGTTLKDILAHQLFDPILMSTEKQGYELRYADNLYRVEKMSFPGSIDLRHQQTSLLNYQIRSVEHTGGRHLEILISESCLSEFRKKIKGLLELPADPNYKAKRIEQCIRDLVEQTRASRSALSQVLELKQWLGTKLHRLAGTKSEVNVLPQLLANLWLQRVDSKLHLKSPSFFFNPNRHSEKTFIAFFSPYREF